jgi:hypothetical protein
MLKQMVLHSSIESASECQIRAGSDLDRDAASAGRGVRVTRFAEL